MGADSQLHKKNLKRRFDKIFNVELKLKSAYGTNKKVRECMQNAYVHFKINFKNYDYDSGWSTTSKRIATEQTDIASASRHLANILFQEWINELGEGITSVEIFKGTERLNKLRTKEELTEITKTEYIHEQLDKILNSMKEDITPGKDVLPKEFSEFKIYKYNNKLLLTIKVPDYVDNQTTVEAFLRETTPIPENCNFSGFIDEHIEDDDIITRGSPVTEVVSRRDMRAYRIRIYNIPVHYNPAVSQFIYIPGLQVFEEEESRR